MGSHVSDKFVQTLCYSRLKGSSAFALWLIPSEATMLRDDTLLKGSLTIPPRVIPSVGERLVNFVSERHSFQDIFDGPVLVR